MRFLKINILLLCTILLGSGNQEYLSIGDFKLENGKSIENCTIGFQRFGRTNHDSSNIVVVPTWFSGKSDHVANLVGENNLYDSTRYHIIIIDALGNGVSTSPSNSPVQKNEEFPSITIYDMVRSQYILLHDKMEIHDVHAIVGGSMGGMQTFQWIVSYPNFSTKAISYVGSPWPSTYSKLIWETELLIIESGLKNHKPDSLIAEQVAMVQLLTAYTPAYRNRKTDPPDLLKFQNDYIARFSRNFNSYNWICQLNAMNYHDIHRYISKSDEIPSILNSTDILLMVSKQDHLVTPGPALKFAGEYDIKTHIFDNDCGHLAPGCEKNEFIRIVNQFISQ
ncbi:MAG: alpha/beta fold hydrolase [Candidatus Marinimicrobia bacterium]|nr:alpha/beta fold hydrolase [Candidatus Neomarinimicrobiota bacterium]